MSSTYTCSACGRIVTGWHESEDTCWDCCRAFWPELHARESWYVPPERLIEVPRLEDLEVHLFPASDVSFRSLEDGAFPPAGYRFFRREHEADWRLDRMKNRPVVRWHAADPSPCDVPLLGVPVPNPAAWVNSHDDIPF
jgi:hypothetical protein